MPVGSALVRPTPQRHPLEVFRGPATSLRSGSRFSALRRFQQNLRPHRLCVKLAPAGASVCPSFDRGIDRLPVSVPEPSTYPLPGANGSLSGSSGVAVLTVDDQAACRRAVGAVVDATPGFQ